VGAPASDCFSTYSQSLDYPIVEAQMTDITSEFNRVIGACMAQAHAHTLATERVIPLYPDLSAEERGLAALKELRSILDTLEMVKEKLPAHAYHARCRVSPVAAHPWAEAETEFAALV